jgi:hypothetical protein
LQIEAAFISNTTVVMCSLDYKKFVGSCDFQFSSKLLLAHGVPKPLVALWLDLCTSMFRVTEIGPSLGVPEQPYNGVGQGDPLSLIPALLLVYMQFKMVGHLYGAVPATVRHLPRCCTCHGAAPATVLYLPRCCTCHGAVFLGLGLGLGLV